MTKKKMPGAPPALQKAGTDLWEATAKVYDLSGHELALLAQACRTLDVCEGLWRAVKKQGYSVQGSMGQTVANPLLQELRQQRSLFASLVRALDLPDVEAEASSEVTPLTDVATLQQRAAGLSRWAKAHG